MSEKRKLRTKNKTTRTSKGTRARNIETEKAYLELVKAQNNLKFAGIKKRSSSSLSDSNRNDREDILENISYQKNITQFKVMTDEFLKTR